MSPRPGTTGVENRVISFNPGLPAIPERLLLAHAQGRVLFIVGAGVSRASGLPDFRGLVLDVYAEVDHAVYEILTAVPTHACNQWTTNLRSLSDRQAAEVRQFIAGDYDVVLGMLERRLDNVASETSRVRQAIAATLRRPGLKSAPIHRALMRLAEREGVVTIVTTNFEHLLEDAAKKGSATQTYTLGAIPRPGYGPEFSGVFHIHGVLDRNPVRTSEFIVSDRDFGEFYMRRRIVPDFIYDAARLFHIVLVGYSANDAPMKYLLNAVAADGTRFEDVKERFSFVAGSTAVDHVTLEQWRGRGIEPIHYDSAANHAALSRVLERWADLSVVNGKKGLVEREIRRVVTKSRKAADGADRDLFDHLIRRGDASERARLGQIASNAGADPGWLDAITDVTYEYTGRSR